MNSKFNTKTTTNKFKDKKKPYDFTEIAEKKKSFLNKTGALGKEDKGILLSENPNKKTKQKIKGNIINEKPDQINKSINIDNKKKLMSFQTSNNNLSQNLYNKLLDNPKKEKEKREIKSFISFNNNNKKKSSKLIKTYDIPRDNILNNRLMLYKQPITETENNIDESVTKIDEDSILISNKKFLCFEPFDLNYAYIKPRKTIKDELINLLDKNKVKYRTVSNTRIMVELKKENLSIGIKFDKLSVINEEKEEENGNNIRISIIKIKKLNGGYQSKLNSFEKIINKMS